MGIHYDIRGYCVGFGVHGSGSYGVGVTIWGLAYMVKPYNRPHYHVMVVSGV